MNWSKLFIQKETWSTMAFRKIEWAGQFVEIDGATLTSGFPEGGKSTKVGHGRCELESHGAFAPEARGQLRLILDGNDWWGEYANDRFAFTSGDESVRVRLDEPGITVEGGEPIRFELPRGKGNFVLCGARRGERFLGYIPASLKGGGVMSFLFGSSPANPWFIPAREPWAGKALVASAKVPPEMGKALADEGAWQALAGEEALFPALLVARAMLAALQFIRFG
ncbi:MAG: hypothetical protein HUU15_16975 [Candidatus Brocadiae bacterium]|nr:hypothetical protein [Candidatus Brocadiia bacterium]